ncbi:hypothetical protein D3C85_1773830 [compost metagenome]
MGHWCALIDRGRVVPQAQLIVCQQVSKRLGPTGTQELPIEPVRHQADLHARLLVAAPQVADEQSQILR